MSACVHVIYLGNSLHCHLETSTLYALFHTKHPFCSVSSVMFPYSQLLYPHQYISHLMFSCNINVTLYDTLYNCVFHTCTRGYTHFD